MHPIAQKILNFCREYKLHAGHTIPARPFVSVFMQQDLNPKEQGQVDQALDELRADGYLDGERLTEKGFDLIYNEEFGAAEDFLGFSSTVQNYHFHGVGQNIQIGDNNTQHIVSAMESLAKEINRADVAEADKQDAKSVLAMLLDNPTVNRLLGPSIEGAKALLN